MNPLKQLAGQTAVYGLSSILGRFLNYLLVPIQTRVFLTGEYGVVSEMYAYVTFLIIIFTYGMETAYFRFSQKEDNKELVFSTSLLSLIFTSSILAGLLSFFSSSIGHLLRYSQDATFHDPDYGKYITWFAWILAFDAISSIPFARLRQQNRAKRFALIKMLNILFTIGLNVFFLVICPFILKSGNKTLSDFVGIIYDPAAGVAYVFISNLIASGITILMLLPEIFETKMTFKVQLWLKMIPYALPLLIVGMAGMVNETIDRVLLKYLLPDKTSSLSQVGIYSACYKLSILMTLFIQAFRYAAEPFFFSHAGKENAKEVYANVMKYFVITCSFIFLGIMLYMDIVKHFIGEKYYSGLNVVPILLFANLCLGVYYNLSIWFKLTGQTRFGAYISIFGALITLLLNYLWIPVFGITGSAWATLICYASMMILSYFTGQKYYPIRYPLKKIFSYLSLSLILYFASSYLHTMDFINKNIHFIISTLFIFTFLTVVFLLERPKKVVP